MLQDRRISREITCDLIVVCCHVNINLQQVCSSQLAAGLQFATCGRSAVRNLHQVCSSQLASGLQFATCIRSAVRNLHQVCSSQLASSLLTTCSRLDIIKPEQAMRTHPDIALMIASCNKPAADLLQLVCFCRCIGRFYIFCSNSCTCFMSIIILLYLIFSQFL